MKNNYAVEKEQVGLRLDNFLLNNLNMTRSQIKNLVKNAQVLVNEKIATKAGLKLKYNDQIEVNLEEKKELDITPENIPLDIVYEDEYLAVINKPKNMVVHPASGNYSGTLVNALLYHFKNLSNVNNDNIRPGIVHRLDKDTTGLLVIAKTNEAHVSLAQQIKEKSAKRVYEAICSGVFKEDAGTINKNIARSPKDRKKMDVTTEGQGKVAITEYEVIKRFNRFTHVRFKLFTGRTHQIRVHSKYIGHPVLGDATYGYTYKSIKPASQLLHAKFLSFTHPINGKEMQFEAKLPKEFENALIKVGNLI